MRRCETCVFHDGEHPVAQREYLGGEWVQSVVLEYPCVLHDMNLHYKGDVCPDWDESAEARAERREADRDRMIEEQILNAGA